MKTLSCVAICVLFFLLIMEIWVKYPDNHGAGIDAYKVPWVVTVIVNVCYMIWIRRIALYRIAALALFVLLLFLCDRFNVVVDYEEWTARGMPDWGVLQR